MTNDKARALGSDLADRRKAAGVTLDDMSRDTKIRRPILEAIEAGDFDQLPPDVFVAGFLKAYCRRLDVDPEPYLKRFLNRYDPEQENTVEAPDNASEGKGPTRWMIWALVLVVVAAIAAAVLWWTGILAFGPAEPPAPPPPPPKVAVNTLPAVPANALSPNTPIEENRSAESGTAPVSSDAPAVESNSQPAASADAPAELPKGDLVITCTQSCWLTLRVDGERKVYRLLTPGETLAFNGTLFSADIGNAAGLKITYKGKAVDLPSVEDKVLKNFVIPRPEGEKKAP